jgi:hypothetical protein
MMPAVMFAPSFDGNQLPIGTRNPNEQKLRQYINKYSLQSNGQLIKQLLGTAPGATATRTRGRVKHQSGSAVDQGGKVQIETETLINRATTAQDDTNLTALFDNPRRAPTTYVADRGGNGGPAFTPGV